LIQSYPPKRAQQQSISSAAAINFQAAAGFIAFMIACAPVLVLGWYVWPALDDFGKWNEMAYQRSPVDHVWSIYQTWSGRVLVEFANRAASLADCVFWLTGGIAYALPLAGGVLWLAGLYGVSPVRRRHLTLVMASGLAAPGNALRAAVGGSGLTLSPAVSFGFVLAWSASMAAASIGATLPLSAIPDFIGNRTGFFPGVFLLAASAGLTFSCVSALWLHLAPA
jgi:hypothetical protein